MHLLPLNHFVDSVIQKIRQPLNLSRFSDAAHVSRFLLDTYKI